MLDLKDIENDVINFPYFGENIQDHVQIMLYAQDQS